MKITYTRYNSLTGIDVPKSAEVTRVEKYPDNETAYHLHNGKAIFVNPYRSELWGKSGYLGIVENVTVVEQMKKIVAVYKKKTLKTNWGFVFDTDVQMFVEEFMNKIHIGSTDYWLCFDEDKPDGVYTNVNVLPTENNKCRFIF